jgi:VWFA-related protein
VFRGGTHFVRVDAYPMEDGKIVEGLSAEDFEILEDGKPQKIDSFDFLKFDSFTPEQERRDPVSQRAGFDMAADPRYRVFVIFVDVAFNVQRGPFVSISSLPRIQQPLVDFLDRMLGPQDLYGFLTSRNTAKELVLAQKSTVTRTQIMDLWRAAEIDKDDADELDRCSCGEAEKDPELCKAMIASLKIRHRADDTYTALQSLILQLGSLRQERKNIVFASNMLPRWRPDDKVLNYRGAAIPRVGIENGRIGQGARNEMGGGANEGYCTSEFGRLAGMDFDSRYRQLLKDARQENVSFYVITPAGLQAAVTVTAARAIQSETDDLVSLANETDGLAIVNTNDLTGGMKKIADALAAYYVLGYYTTNTKFDGGVRNIKVRLKANGKTVRARRQYRAPTQAEIAALTAAPAASAAPALPPGPVTYTLVGEPKAFRSTSRSIPEPVTAFEFARNERLRVEWPVLASLDRREVRLLTKAGKPLPVDLPLAEDTARSVAIVEMSLSAFIPGEYQIELTVGAGAVKETRVLAIRVK